MGGLDLTLRGGAQYLELSKQLKALGDKGLGQRMDKGLRAAAAPIKTAVQAEAAATMPTGGGFAGVLSAAVKTRTQSRRGRYAARLSVVVFASGKQERRDVPDINRGVLRHPVFGRYRRVRGQKVTRPWVAQKVRAGFVDRPFAEAAPRVQTEMVKVLDEVTRELAGR